MSSPLRSQHFLQPILLRPSLLITLSTIMICWESFLPLESQFLADRKSGLSWISSPAPSTGPRRQQVLSKCLSNEQPVALVFVLWVRAVHSQPQDAFVKEE